jgi:hypothetical protein
MNEGFPLWSLNYRGVSKEVTINIISGRQRTLKSQVHISNRHSWALMVKKALIGSIPLID